jgi:hypothetical protein
MEEHSGAGMRSGAPVRRGGGGLAGAITFDALMLALIAASWLTDLFRPDVYYRLVAEDGPVEWATFWALVVGVVANAMLARRAARDGVLHAWYEAGVALFCFLVAGEEISWGQRLFGYLPPNYFLAHNVQLEANIHNLLWPIVWVTGIQVIIGGFGVVLPALLLARTPARIARRAGVYAPPAGWIPGFAALFTFYALRPFHLCEEVVELFLGLGLGLSGLWQWLQERGPSPITSRGGRVPALLGSAVLVASLGAATAAITETGSARDDALISQARAELEALRQDFVEMRRERGGQFVTQCDLNVRLHTLDRVAHLEKLHEGEFARVAGRSSPERARYLLDPWNMPYWLSDQCDSAARYILLYSFGPNRKRDSTHWEVGGDDVGSYAFHLGTPRPLDWRHLVFPEKP